MVNSTLRKFLKSAAAAGSSSLSGWTGCLRKPAKKTYSRYAVSFGMLITVLALSISNSFGLRTAQTWRKRLGLEREKKWDEVLSKLSPLPVSDSVYIVYEGIKDMWTSYAFEHPALTGIYGMLPGDGVDTACFKRTLRKVVLSWDFNRTWGWDFPMLAMAAARTGDPELAVNMLLYPSVQFQFDEHGLASGGPFPYFPSNGALLTAVAMMTAGIEKKN